MRSGRGQIWTTTPETRAPVQLACGDRKTDKVKRHHPIGMTASQSSDAPAPSHPLVLKDERLRGHYTTRGVSAQVSYLRSGGCPCTRARLDAATSGAATYHSALQR